MRSAASGAVLCDGCGGWGSSEVVFEAGEAAACACCARYSLVEVNALRVSACLSNRCARSCLLERSGCDGSRRLLKGSCGRC